MLIDVVGRTDMGMVRPHNDDRYEIRRNLPGGGVLCVLADGMGGYASGDLAATIAVGAVVTGVENGGELAAAVANANAEIYRRSQAEARHQGMGTTLTGVIIHDGLAQFIHVGDSRMYLVRGGMVRQLTTDHSWVAEEVRAGRMTAEEARTSRSRNIITRALGLNDAVSTDSGTCPLSVGDALLLCSDGVHNLVSDEELAGACVQSASQGVDDLVATVCARGAPDNATVVIARLLSDGTEPTRALITRPLPDMAADDTPVEGGAGAAGNPPPREGPSAARSREQGTGRRKGFTVVAIALLLLVLMALGALVHFGLLGHAS